MSEIKSNIFYCTICQYPEEALPNAYRVRPYVNEIIIVHNQPVIAQVKAEFDDLGATLHYVDWKEDFSYKRTQYIRKTGEIIKEKGFEKKSEKKSENDNFCNYNKNNTWMLISDTDEFISMHLLENLNKIITKAELEKSTVCTINSHDYLIKGEETDSPFTFIPRSLEEIDKSEIISQSISNYHKELLVKYQDKLEYTGKVHHTLRGTGLKIMQAPKEYYYDHIKKDADLHSHGCRNWFIGGGGVQEFGEKWKIFRLITNKYGLDSWEKMEKAMKIGNIQSDIKQFFVDHKDDNETSSDSEIRSFYSYYDMLHHEELKDITQNVKNVITKDKIFVTSSKTNVIKINENDVNVINGLYYDPLWKKEYSEPKLNYQKVNISSDKSNTKTFFNQKLEKNIKKDVENPVENIVKIDVKPILDVPRIPFPSENIPNLSINESEDEIMEFVEDTYIQILGRVGDPGGIKNYTEAIISGRLKKRNLANIFRKSEEYIDKGLET